MPIACMAWCGPRALCVGHADEYCLLDVASGVVRELFRFAPQYGCPWVRPLAGCAELLACQPPPRAGERIVGLFVDAHGAAARRSTVHWRTTPLDAVARHGAIVCVLPNAVEVLPRAGLPRRRRDGTEGGQKLRLPLDDALCADDGGEWLLIASQHAVYALLPPEVPTNLHDQPTL